MFDMQRNLYCNTTIVHIHCLIAICLPIILLIFFRIWSILGLIDNVYPFISLHPATTKAPILAIGATNCWNELYLPIKSRKSHITYRHYILYIYIFCYWLLSPTKTIHCLNYSQFEQMYHTALNWTRCLLFYCICKSHHHQSRGSRHQTREKRRESW